MDPVELLNRRLWRDAHKCVRELDQQPIGNSVVDVRVRPVQIAQRALEPMGHLLEEEPLMVSRRDEIPAHRETKLEGHIEARHPRLRSRPLNTAEIVNRISTRPDQLHDPVEPPPAAGDLERRARVQPKPTQARNEGDVETLVAVIVRDVQEDRLGRGRSRCDWRASRSGRLAAAATSLRARLCEGAVSRTGKDVRDHGLDGLHLPAGDAVCLCDFLHRGIRGRDEDPAPRHDKTLPAAPRRCQRIKMCTPLRRACHSP